MAESQVFRQFHNMAQVLAETLCSAAGAAAAAAKAPSAVAAVAAAGSAPLILTCEVHANHESRD